MEDGLRQSLRKKSVSQSDSVFLPSNSSVSPSVAIPNDSLEPLLLNDALAKLFNPDGCDEEFENVFLGLFHYFMSWSLFVHHFGVVVKQAQQIPPVSRSRHTNRLVQVPFHF